MTQLPRFRSSPFALALLAALSSPAFATDDPVLARWNGGEVRVSDVRRERDFLPPDEQRFRERTAAGGERAISDWVRRIALRGIARAEANARGGPSAETAARARGEALRWASQRLRERGYGRPVAPVVEEEVRRELVSSDPGLPPRVRLSGIFRPATTPEEIAAEIALLEAVRAERPDLRCFRERARSLSRGSAAARDGEIGWIRQGWLDPEVERLLLAMPAGSVSPPVVLRGGVHLFFVEETAAASSAVSDGAVLAEASRRRSARLDAARGEALREAGFRADPGLSPAEAERRQDEALLALALRRGLLDERERQVLADREANVLLAAAIEEERERRFVPPSDSDLARRWVEVGDRWRTPVRYEIALLRVRAAGAPDPVALWSALQAAAEAARSGDQGWDEVVKAFPGEVEAIPLEEAHQVAGRVGPPLFEALRDLPAGGVAGPIQDGAELLLARVVRREDSRPRTFEESRDRLVADLSKETRRRLSDEIASEMLTRARFEWDPAAPAVMVRLAAEAEIR